MSKIADILNVKQKKTPPLAMARPHRIKMAPGSGPDVFEEPKKNRVDRLTLRAELLAARLHVPTSLL